MNPIRRRIGRWLADFLTRPGHTSPTGPATRARDLARCLRPGDVLLVEGTTRIGSAIRYLTQSTWSHAALFVGPHPGTPDDGDADWFIEADLVDGVRAVPLSTYAGLYVRICRPVGLYPEEIDAIIRHATDRLGHQYDLRNVFDLARYLVRTPPVPSRVRRQLLGFGSGDPTQAICSTLIAQAFQSVRYPILPMPGYAGITEGHHGSHRGPIRARHHSLFVPRDFDVSPYFAIVKPTLEAGFDPHKLEWIGSIEPRIEDEA